MMIVLSSSYFSCKILGSKIHTHIYTYTEITEESNNHATQPCLIVEIPRIPFVVLIAAVLGRRFLPLCVISHVMLENAGESHRWQHAHHRSQCQHQPYHHTGEIDRTDGIQGHWKENKVVGERRFGRGWGRRNKANKRSDTEEDGMNVKPGQQPSQSARRR